MWSMNIVQAPVNQITNQNKKFLIDRIKFYINFSYKYYIIIIINIKN